MGTRNSTLVKVDGKIKVAQYGQWDGYPTGQGTTIQEFLREVDLEDFKNKVRKVRELTKEESDALNLTDWKKTHPHLSRDAGADILNMIAAGKVESVVLDEDFKNDTLFCEYWYELDLDNEIITMNGQKYTFEEWKKDGFMEELEKDEEDDED